MMKKLVALAALVAATPAFAQTWDGAGQQPIVFSGTWTPNTGAVDADALEPAKVTETGFTEADWIITTDGTTDYTQIVGRERKFRITCPPSIAGRFDPIIYPGQSNVGHRHQFTGAFNVSTSATYNTLRTNLSSSCTGGGALNNVAYWEPEMIKKMTNGLEVGLRQSTDIFYYINGAQGDPQRLTWLRRNFGYIGGADPMNYNDTARRNAYAASGEAYPGGTDYPAGFGGWQCYSGADPNTPQTVTRVASRMGAATNRARHIVAPDGTDPWGGTCTGSVALPGQMMSDVVAPDCWDGKNLRSPDGRSHVAYSVGGVKCPNGWVMIPKLESKKNFRHTGFSDYSKWYLSSDRMNPAGTAADPTSHDPCRQTGPWFCPGSTVHFDWIYGWNSDIADEWQRECLGLSVRGTAPVNGPAECDTSQISKFRKMKYDGASPNSALTGGCAIISGCNNAVPGNTQRYNALPAGTSADVVIDHNH